MTSKLIEQAANVRPQLLRYTLRLDDPLFTSFARDVAASKRAGLRLGRDWRPRKPAERKKNADDHWATFEHLKPLNDVCTKFCSKNYFPDAFARVIMIVNVLRVYQRVAALSRLPFRIVFKGGVMIRLVLLEFLHDVPLESRLKAIAHLVEQHALSLSDLDFEIVMDDHKPSPDKVHRLLALDYAVLLWLQREMQRQIEAEQREGLLSLEWSGDTASKEEDLRTRLQEAIDELDDEENPLRGATVDRISLSGVAPTMRGYATKSQKAVPDVRRNVVIFDCEDDKCVMPASEFFAALGVRGVPSRSGGDRLYATLNAYIGEGVTPQRDNHVTGLFHLARIKHAFVVHYTTRKGEKRCDRLGGEMVDLSQSHGIQRDALRAALYAAVPHPYADYALLGTRDVVIRSYSVEGFLYEHMIMVHHTETAPWKANKLSKRLARYVAFFIAHVLGPKVPGTPATKARALQRLVERTGQGTDQLANGGALRSGLAAVDAFFARERAAVGAAQAGERRAATAYLRTLHGHLAALTASVAHARRFEGPYVPRIDPVHLQLARHHVRT